MPHVKTSLSNIILGTNSLQFELIRPSPFVKNSLKYNNVAYIYTLHISTKKIIIFRWHITLHCYSRISPPIKIYIHFPMLGKSKLISSHIACYWPNYIHGRNSLNINEVLAACWHWFENMINDNEKWLLLMYDYRLAWFVGCSLKLLDSFLYYFWSLILSDLLLLEFVFFWDVGRCFDCVFLT